MIHELDNVRLKVSKPGVHLPEGAPGTVVHVYRGGDAVEVEFFEMDGNTSGVFTVSPSDLVPAENWIPAPENAKSRLYRAGRTVLSIVRDIFGPSRRDASKTGYERKKYGEYNS